MADQGGDDLGDDYIPDELVASSGDEEVSQRGSSHGDLSLDDDVPKPSGSAAHAESEKRNKRKRSGKDKQRKLKVGISTFGLSETKYSRAETQVKGDAGRTVPANRATVTFRTRRVPCWASSEVISQVVSHRARGHPDPW